MKKKTVWALALFTLLMVGCQNEEKYSGPQYSLSDFAGEWIIKYVNGVVIPSCSTNIDSMDAYGKGVTISMSDDYTTLIRESFSSSIKNDVITYKYDNATYSYKIISRGQNTLFFESLNTGILIEAQKAVCDYREEILGKWVLKEEDGNPSTVFLTDGCFESTEITDSTDCFYSLYGDLLLRKEAGKYNASFISFDMTQDGFVMTNYFVDSALVVHERKYYKNVAEYTYEDLQGTWFLAKIDDQENLIDHLNILEIEENISTLSYISNQRWVSSTKSFTLADNVLSTDSSSCSLLYVNASTIILKNKEGVIYTMGRIFKPDENKERILGPWLLSIATKISESMLFLEDSMYVKLEGIGEDRLFNMVYELYGDVLVVQSEKTCKAFFVSFGYDVDREERSLTITIAEGVSTTFYQPDFEKALGGFWLSYKEKGEVIAPRYLNFYDTNNNQYVSKDLITGKLLCSSSYTLSRDTVKLTELTGEWAYFIVTGMTDSTMDYRSVAGYTYTDYKVVPDEALIKGIVGTWTCAEFTNEENVKSNNIKHIFDENGLVMLCTETDTMAYGTYKLYGDVLLISAKKNNVTKNMLWAINIQDNIMNWYARYDDNGSMVEIKNAMTKAVN